VALPNCVVTTASIGNTGTYFYTFYLLAPGFVKPPANLGKGFLSRLPGEMGNPTSLQSGMTGKIRSPPAGTLRIFAAFSKSGVFVSSPKGGLFLKIVKKPSR
jgi:hypothetical protein